jgi:hypothetical protein
LSDEDDLYGIEAAAVIAVAIAVVAVAIAVRGVF